jgi:hypothetical protein
MPTQPVVHDVRRAEALGSLQPDAVVTTSEAAFLCGFRTTSALRKAQMEGRIRPVGYRGGRGTLAWRVGDLIRFMRGEPPHPRIRAPRDALAR